MQERRRAGWTNPLPTKFCTDRACSNPRATVGVMTTRRTLHKDGCVPSKKANKAWEASGREQPLSPWKNEEDFNKQDGDDVKEALPAKVWR